jgi:hypothetical protein
MTSSRSSQTLIDALTTTEYLNDEAVTFNVADGLFAIADAITRLAVANERAMEIEERRQAMIEQRRAHMEQVFDTMIDRTQRGDH